MAAEDDYDLIFKVVLTGDSGVGKSNILSRYLKDEFNLQTKTTVGVEFGAKKIEIDGMKIKAQIWDTAGQERYKSITSAYYKGSKGALLVYDITKRESFDNIDKWLSDLKKNSDPDITVILIGNKCDLEEDRQITQEEAQAKAAHYRKTILIFLEIAYLETSACRKINIEKAFQLMIEEIYKKYQKVLGDDLDGEEELSNSQNVFDINTQKAADQKDKNKKKCC